MAKDCHLDSDNDGSDVINLDTNINQNICSSNIENMQYISNDLSELEKCRFGLLPKNLDILLNNKQELFITQTGSSLKENSNLFLRRGINKNIKDNILETFSVIMGYSLEQLKDLIIKKLTPDVFITLNNGELIDIYASKNILPNSINDYEKFNIFIKHYILFFNLMDIDASIIERLQYKDIEIINKTLNNNTELENKLENIDKTVLAGYIDDIDNIKKLILFYKIYTAFYNFIEHINYDKEKKDYTHFLDLFSSPISWLNKDGCNILLFDSTGSKMLCNPYCDKDRKKYIILIREKINHFVPLFHINYIFKNSTLNGIYDIKTINLNTLSYNFFEKKKLNVKLLDLTKKRDDKIINLILIHSNICKYENYQNTEKLLKDFESLDINLDNQIAMTTTQIEFIKLSNNYLVPIYPMAIRVKQHTNKFKLLSKQDMIPLNNYINYNNKDTQFETLLLQNGYKISKIFYDELKGLITSIQFENNLIVPVIAEPYTYNNTKDIISKMIKSKNLTSINDIRIETLFRPAHFDFYLEMSPEIEILNLRNNIYKDFIYNYFKYEFSRILQEKANKKIKQILIKAIEQYIVNKINFNNTIDTIVELIINIMKKRIYNYQNLKNSNYKNRNEDKRDSKDKRDNKDKTDYISIKVCSKTKKATKFCKAKEDNINKQSKEFFLDMNKEQLEYFSYLIANDLINKKIEANEILIGSFIPEFNMRNKIYHKPDEITISSTNELLHNIGENMYSKYKQNILLSNFIKDEKEYIFTDDDITSLNKTNINEFKIKMNTIIADLVDLSIRNIFIEDKIYTTPFNKDSKYDKSVPIDDCKFPYINKHTGKYIYQCVNKPNGYMCPTKLDYTRTKADNWGYCPENLYDTKKKLKVIEIHAEGDENNKDYKEGQCDIPFVSKEIKNVNKNGDNNIDNEYSLKYECNEVKDSNNKMIYSWCPIKYNINKTKKNNKNDKNDKNDKNNKNDKNEDINEDINDTSLLKAATNLEHIKSGKWYNGKLLINKLTNKKYTKGYCQPPIKTLKINNKKHKDDNDNDNDKKIILTLNNYKPGNCNINLTPSKGGYTKPQLYNFGVDYLKIPHTQLRKDNKIDGIKLQKEILCKIINNKYREIQKSYGTTIGNNDNILVNAYEKDIEQCINGESKGGYSWPKLKDIAITYYGLTEDEIKEKEYKKEDLCKYISNIINNNQEKSKGEDSDNLQQDLENIKNNFREDDKQNDIKQYKYNGDIKLCNETPKKGGLSLSKVKNIAMKNFNIDIKNKSKKELCKLIGYKLQYQQKQTILKKDNKNKNTDEDEDEDEDEDDDEDDDEDEDDEDEDEDDEDEDK